MYVGNSRGKDMLVSFHPRLQWLLLKTLIQGFLYVKNDAHDPRNSNQIYKHENDEHKKTANKSGGFNLLTFILGFVISSTLVPEVFLYFSPLEMREPRSGD